jgi:hypothetical protein
MAGKLDQPDVQSFLTLLLSLTGFPGLPGRDENISEVSSLTFTPPTKELTRRTANSHALLHNTRRTDGESRFPVRLRNFSELEHRQDVLLAGCQ